MYYQNDQLTIDFTHVIAICYNEESKQLTVQTLNNSVTYNINLGFQGNVIISEFAKYLKERDQDSRMAENYIRSIQNSMLTNNKLNEYENS